MIVYMVRMYISYSTVILSFCRLVFCPSLHMHLIYSIPKNLYITDVIIQWNRFHVPVYVIIKLFEFWLPGIRNVSPKVNIPHNQPKPNKKTQPHQSQQRRGNKRYAQKKKSAQKIIFNPTKFLLYIYFIFIKIKFIFIFVSRRMLSI